MQRTCHPLAHEIGHLAFAKYHSVTTAEGYARETCWSGYHHGLMESYISQFSDKQLRARMNGICKQDPSHPYSLAYYNCWHGLGHGLTIRWQQDIFHALRFCNAIGHEWERESCYSGVFMQNIVANGSGMHRSVDLKPSDPIYPCDAVTEREKPSCYLMQTSYVLQVKGWKLPVAFRICDRVEARYVGTCYRSMGRDISGAALLDPRKVASQCALGAAKSTARTASPGPLPTRSTTATRARWPMPSAASCTQPSARPAWLPPIRPCPRSDHSRQTALVSDACAACSQSQHSRQSRRSSSASPRREPRRRLVFTSTTAADRGGVKGAISYRARAVTPQNGHWRALQLAFVRAHNTPTVTPPIPLRLLEATHQRVLWALATFGLGDGTIVAERFSWRQGVGWRDLGATRALCPAVPPEVRGVWRLGICG